MTLVAIMRPKDRLEESRALAAAMGFEAVCASPIDIEVRGSPEFDRFIVSLTEGEDPVVVFTSATGVKACQELARRNDGGNDLSGLLRKATLVAVGPATARALERHGLEVQHVPEEFTSKGLVASARGWRAEGRKCYVLRSDHGSGELVPGLTQAGMAVQEIVVYSLRRQPRSEELEHLIELGRRGEVDVFLFTSSLSARTLVDAWAVRDGLEAAVRALNSRKVAAIGPPTRQALESYGVKVDIVPVQATFGSLLRAVGEASASSLLSGKYHLQ